MAAEQLRFMRLRNYMERVLFDFTRRSGHPSVRNLQTPLLPETSNTDLSWIPTGSWGWHERFDTG